MRKRLHRLGEIVVVCLLGIFLVSCSTFGRSKPAEKPQTQKPAEKKPGKAASKKLDVQSKIDEGKAYRAQGDLRKALAAFKQALKIEPGNADAEAQLEDTQQELDAAIDAHLKQGVKYSMQENLQDAMAEWQKVLALDPTNKEALQYKAQTQQKLDALGNK